MRLQSSLGASSVLKETSKMFATEVSVVAMGSRTAAEESRKMFLGGALGLTVVVGRTQDGYVPVPCTLRYCPWDPRIGFFLQF